MTFGERWGTARARSVAVPRLSSAHSCLVRREQPSISLGDGGETEQQQQLEHPPAKLQQAADPQGWTTTGRHKQHRCSFFYSGVLFFLFLEPS